MNTVELKTSGAYWRRIAILWALFGFIGLAITATAKLSALGIFGISIMLAPAFLLIRRRMTWAARFDGTGVTLRSGKQLAWADFEKVVDVHTVKGGHNHYQLVFRGGRARVFDRMLANAGEVVGILSGLARGENLLIRGR
jgi:hypothetical protein